MNPEGVVVMARPNKPWFWKQKKAWYVTIDGKRTRLAKTKSEATQEFYKLMAGKEPDEIESGSIEELFNLFLDWVAHHQPKVYDWYKPHLQGFKDSYPQLMIAELKPHHVEVWSRGKGVTQKIRCLKRALNWGVEQGHLKFSPIAKMKVPKPLPRPEILSDKDWKKLLRLIPDDNFKDLLRFSWETGARPQESKAVCSHHVDLDEGVVTFEVIEAKKHIKRHVILNDEAIKILQRNWREDGPIFRNTSGTPWTKDAVNCRFNRLADEKKFGRKVCQYMFRHTWITRMLKSGLDAHTVAALAGHKDTSMIDRVYSKISADHQYLRDQLQKAS